MVDKLESWERHARRRNKAFGQHDPSAPAGDLDAEQQQQKQYLKTLRRKASELQTWDGGKFGDEHEEKIGNWGVSVKAEAERARNWDWGDDKQQLHYFARLSESQPRTEAGKGMWKYTFEPKAEDGKDGGQSSTSSADSGYYSNTAATGQTEDVTPPSSTSYLPHTAPSSALSVGQIVDADRELCIKVLVGRTGSKHSKLPDVASAGWCWFIPSFEDPDSGAAGMARVGAKTQIRFEKDEIDFRKEPLGLIALEVEWEWVSVGFDDGSSDHGH